MARVATAEATAVTEDIVALQTTVLQATVLQVVVPRAMVPQAMAVLEMLQATAVGMAEDRAVRLATGEARAMAGVGAATAEDLLIALRATAGAAAIHLAEVTLAVVEEADIPAAEAEAIRAGGAAEVTPEAITKPTTVYRVAVNVAVTEAKRAC
jgi:hypothetical protein